MEQKTYNELQSKINGIEAELERAKLELESSKKDDFKEEVISYLNRAGQFDIQAHSFQEDLEDVKKVILGLLENNDTNEYILAKQYFSSFKERFQVVEEKWKEHNQGIISLDAMLKVIKNELQ